MTRSTAWLAPGALDSFPLCFTLSLVIDRSAEQRKLDRIHERPQKSVRSSDIGFGDMVDDFMQLFSDGHDNGPLLPS
jgi:hypothetical protein